MLSEVLVTAHQKGINFSVFITECRPYCEGYTLYEKLKKEGIECQVVLDSAAAYCLEEAEFVLVGAEGIVENGGIINRVKNPHVLYILNK